MLDSYIIENIGAKKLPGGCVVELGKHVKYPKQLRNNIKLTMDSDETGEDVIITNMAVFMSGIDEVIKVSNLIYEGKSVFDGKIYPFKIDLGSKKVRGLFGGRVANITTHRGKRNSFRISKRWNTYFNISLVIACFELLLAGYECDWASVCVNHKDNSAGMRYMFGENVRSDNLELYHADTAVLNTVHGAIWNRMYKLGIYTSFSLYSPFIDHCYELLRENKFTVDNILEWKHKIDGATYIFSFDNK